MCITAAWCWVSSALPDPNARMGQAAFEPPRVQVKVGGWSPHHYRTPVSGCGAEESALVCAPSCSLPAPSTKASACSCPLRAPPHSPREGFSLPAFPSTLPGGLAPTAVSLLLNPETSPLALFHQVSQRRSLRKHPSPRPQGPELASGDRLVAVLLSQAHPGAHGTQAHSCHVG